MKTMNRPIAYVLPGVLAAMSASAVLADIPPHPNELTFAELQFSPPLAADHRHELSNGVPVYLAPSHEFPLITVRFIFKGGSYLESAELTGLGVALGNQMRRGGTTSVPAEELDERFDFLAANVSTRVGDETAQGTLDCLKRNFDEAFALFMDMVRNPGFDEARLRIYQDHRIEQFKQRNDRPGTVARMNLGELVYGTDHHGGRIPTQATIEAINPEQLRALHQRLFHPGNLIIAATGDFEPDEMLAKLYSALEGWPIGERSADPPAPTHVMAPGLYHADTAQKDLPQGTAFLVGKAIRRDDPDAIPLTVMNHILGGGGFTSRVMNRVRSDEGLAYRVQTFIRPEVYYPGIYGGTFQSKNRTVALATKLILEEMERIRNEPVTEEELQLAKNSFTERFPQRFASKSATLGVLVRDEMTGRAPDFWTTYRDNINAVTAADVQRVARKYLIAEELIILVVGNWDEIYEGDLEGRASMNDFFEGNVHHLPSRDPLTMEPLE